MVCFLQREVAPSHQSLDPLCILGFHPGFELREAVDSEGFALVLLTELGTDLPTGERSLMLSVKRRAGEGCHLCSCQGGDTDAAG